MVIIASRWTSYATARRFDNGEGGVEHGRSNPFILGDLKPGSAAFTDALLEHFKRGVERYLQSGYKVILVHPVPEAGWNVPRMAFKIAHFEGRSLDDIDLSTSHKRFRDRNRAVISAFEGLQTDTLIQVRPAEVLCDTFSAGRCANIAGGQILYYDDDHLSTAGADLIVPRILAAVEALHQP